MYSSLLRLFYDMKIKKEGTHLYITALGEECHG
jgi:hypothetical protein